MRIIANENISARVLDELRARGHDVLSVKESMRGAKDPEVLSRGQAEQRVVVTHDKDFGELAFRFGLPAECGIVLFRLAGDTPEADHRRMVDVLESRAEWTGHFSVVDDEKIRVRPLPSASAGGHSSSDS
ncbi:MAG: DUF5615 family PIN-like protein [Rhodopirellula sp.]|nr:DUF5615 family PIN-like protein [Rhodopirellula sp.]